MKWTGESTGCTKSNLPTYQEYSLDYQPHFPPSPTLNNPCVPPFQIPLLLSIPSCSFRIDAECCSPPSATTAVAAAAMPPLRCRRRRNRNPTPGGNPGILRKQKSLSLLLSPSLSTSSFATPPLSASYTVCREEITRLLGAE